MLESLTEAGRHGCSRLDEDATEEAQKQLADAAFRGRVALEKANSEFSASGANEAVAALFDAVCAIERNTAACSAARAKAGSLRIKLAQAEIAAGRFAVGAGQLEAAIDYGEPAATEAQTILASDGFSSGMAAETARHKAQAAVSRCKENQEDCGDAAAVVLADAALDVVAADALRRAVSEFEHRRSRAGEARTAIKALWGECKHLNAQSELGAVCFPDGATAEITDRSFRPSDIARFGMACAGAIGMHRPTMMAVVVGWALALAVLGLGGGLLLGMAVRRRPLLGVLYMIAICGVFAGVVLVQGGFAPTRAHYEAVGLLQGEATQE